MRTLQQYLQGLPIEFIDQLEKFGIIKDFSEQTEILREGQYVKYVPLVLEGAVKVFTRHEDKELLLEWVKSFPSLNELFFNLYDQRYASLLDTINHLLYSRLDQRLYNYLQETARQKNSKIINIRHRQMAAELGTAREVISRVMKKLEQEGKVKQLQGGIEIL